MADDLSLLFNQSFGASSGGNFVGTSTAVPGSNGYPALPSVGSGLNQLAPLSSSAMPADAPGQIGMSTDQIMSGIMNGSAATSLQNLADGNVSGAVSALTSGTGTGTFISEWILRIVVIILGFIFVTVGLSMFKGSAPIVVQTSSRILKKAATGK